MQHAAVNWIYHLFISCANIHTTRGQSIRVQVYTERKANDQDACPTPNLNVSFVHDNIPSFGKSDADRLDWQIDTICFCKRSTRLRMGSVWLPGLLGGGSWGWARRRRRRRRTLSAWLGHRGCFVDRSLSILRVIDNGRICDQTSEIQALVDPCY